MKISCKEDVPICQTNFAKKMERNLHETTIRWKTYGKRLFSEDLEVRDVEAFEMRGLFIYVYLFVCIYVCIHMIYKKK
jgi:hypothetical protein